MQKILMIHEIQEWMLNVDLSEYDVFTFDDGLFSQYRHYKHFLSYDKPMYYFISTDIICPGNIEQNENIISCREAHGMYKKNNKTSYMKWDQIKTLKYNGCFIGGHGHTHLKIEKGMNIGEIYRKIKNECIRMMDEFVINGIKIKSFCFPYNEDIFGYRSTLRGYGIEKFFGKERIAIENINNK